MEARQLKFHEVMFEIIQWVIQSCQGKGKAKKMHMVTEYCVINAFRFIPLEMSAMVTLEWLWRSHHGTPPEYGSY